MNIMHLYGRTNGNYTKGEEFQNFFYARPDIVKAKYILKMSSYKIGRLIRLMSGHNQLN